MTLLERIHSIQAKHPELRSYGFRSLGHELMRQTTSRDSSLVADASFVDQTRLALGWLQNCSRTRGVNRRSTSYGYKHEAECWHEEADGQIAYICNAALIAAALILDFKVVRVPNSPNAYLNLGRKRPLSGGSP